MHHGQEYVDDKECDGDVVEESRKRKIGPKLIGRPEEERDCKQGRLREFAGRSSLRELIGQVGACDERKGQRTQQVVGSIGEESRNEVPHHEDEDGHEGTGAQDPRGAAMKPVDRSMHGRILARCKSFRSYYHREAT